MITLTLTPAQRSALECAGLDIEAIDDDDEKDTAPLRAAWDGRNRLRFDSDRDARWALWDSITTAANAEDGTAENTKDPDTVRLARGACKALTNLAEKVLKFEAQAQIEGN